MDENKLPGGERPAGEISAPDLPGTCPQCGAKLAWDALYCKACGEARPETGWHAPVPPIRETASSPRWGFGVAASPREIAAALAMYVLAWWYLWDSQLSILSIPEIYGGRRSLWPLVFVLGFVGLTELLHWERKRSRESWIWLGCMALITLGIVLGRNQVWDVFQQSLFLHLAAVWWVLCRSGRLVNVGADQDTGVTEVQYPFGQLRPQDINNDGIVEIPYPVEGYVRSTGKVFAWFRFDDRGNSAWVMDTFHNLQDSWYLALHDDWHGRMAGTRLDATEKGTCVTVQVDGKPVLYLYSFSGEDRKKNAQEGGAKL